MFAASEGSSKCMNCYAGSASATSAAECTACVAGDVCPAGTSLDKLGTKQVETTGTLQLDGITTENFESAKTNILQAIKEKVFAEHGVWLDDDDIVLSGTAGGRRSLSATFTLHFTLRMPAAEDSTDANSDNFSDAGSTTASAPLALALDAAAVSELVAASMQTEAVTAALNVSAGELTVAVGETTQQETIVGACPAGKYAAGGMGECTICAPGRAAPKGSSNCSNCDSGSYAAVAGSPVCEKCWVGFFQEEEESTVCLKCRANALTVDAGANSIQGCVCTLGYFDCTTPQDSSVCKQDECNECPFEAICDQAETLESLQGKQGFWRAINTSNVFHQCPKLGACRGGRIVEGNRDQQCATGYVGVRCELCDSENGYAIHQPGDICSVCKPNEGLNSLYLSVATFCGLALLLMTIKFGICPQWLFRVKRVAVINGRHAGRVGKLTGPSNEVDELNCALLAAGTLHPPVAPQSTFELYCRAQRTNGSAKSKDCLQNDWSSASEHEKHLYEERALEEKERYDRIAAQIRRMGYALKRTYAVTLDRDVKHNSRASVFVRGTDLKLRTIDLQDAYQARLTKIKITVQFIQICLRLSSTYRFPMPPVTVEFLNYIKFLEILDVAQIPMNLECWRSFSYINKVYIHTLTCLTIIVILKPEFILAVILAPLSLIRASRCMQPVLALFNRAVRLERHASRIIMQGVTKESKEVRRVSKRLLRRSHKSATKDDDRTVAHAHLDRAAAAIVLQRLWRHHNPAVLAAHHNIATLRQSLLSFVGTAKHLGREDFFFLFSYAVYSSLCDTCFMYFDCNEYENLPCCRRGDQMQRPGGRAVGRISCLHVVHEYSVSSWHPSLLRVGTFSYARGH
jgi:hypothetical protein